MFTNCAVRGIEKSAGRISGVVTEKGPIKTDTVILAGGTWSRRFCSNAGIKLKQLSVVNTVRRTEPIDAGIECINLGRQVCRQKASSMVAIQLPIAT